MGVSTPWKEPPKQSRYPLPSRPTALGLSSAARRGRGRQHGMHPLTQRLPEPETLFSALTSSMGTLANPNTPVWGFLSESEQCGRRLSSSVPEPRHPPSP